MFKFLQTETGTGLALTLLQAISTVIAAHFLKNARETA